jgi:hypothetical protein
VEAGAAPVVYKRIYARKEGMMPRFSTLAALALALAIVPTAVAAGPTFKDRERFAETDTDFCGTGKTVEIEGMVVANVWIGETGGDPEQVLKVTLSLQITYTNPDNGASVVERWANVSTNEIIEGLESGVHTHVFRENGLKATFKLAHGGLITRDAGSLTYAISFDADDNVTDFQVLSVHGPHPGFPDFDFCGIVSESLGL